MKKSRFMHFVYLLIKPPDLDKIRDFQNRGRVSLSLQILFIIFFSLFDFLIIFGYIENAVPGITLLFILIYLVGRFKSPKVSTVLSMALISFVSITSASNLISFEGQSIYGTLIWIAWPVLLASLLLENRETVNFTIVMMLFIFLIPIMNPLVTFTMIIGPTAFIFGISAIAIVSSWMIGKSEARVLSLSQAIQLSPSAVVITDLKGVISYVNPSFVKITEYTVDDATGNNCRILKSGLTPMETYEDLWNTITSNQTWHGFLVNRSKTGRIFHEEKWITPLYNKNGILTSYVGMGVDITARKELERRESEHKKELEIYASLIRHDLRNDLGVILGNIDIGRMVATEADTELLELMESTEAVVTRMSNLLRVFGQSATVIEINPAKLLRRLAALAMEIDSQLKIEVDVDPDSENLEISESRLLPMVFDNLFRNATVHSGEHPVVNVEIKRIYNYAEIIVSDNGPGIAEEVRGRMFRRGASTRGGGLGLYLSKQIILSRNGTIEVADYEEGKGATFIIRLPIIERTI